MKYELRELTDEANDNVRKWNRHIPKNHPIYGIFDKENNCFIAGDGKGPVGYFWSCVKSTAEKGIEILEELKREGKE